jgi:WD40 repeat protein/tetratricopeptide (TPR) repeat protein
MAILSDGRTAITLANTLSQSLLRTWSLETGELIAGPQSVRGRVAALSPNGKIKCIASEGERYGSARQIRYFNASDLAPLQAGPLQDTNVSESTAAIFDPTGAWFITGHAAGDIRFSAVPEFKQAGESIPKDERTKRDVLTGHIGPVTSLAVHPDGKILVSGSQDGTIRLWHMQARQPLIPPDKPHYSGGTGIDPFTKALVSSTAITSPDPHGEPVLRSFEPTNLRDEWDRRKMSVKFSSNGQYLLEASSADAVQRWDLPVGKAVINYRRQPGQIDLSDAADIVAKIDGWTVDVRAMDGSAVSKVNLGEYLSKVVLDRGGQTLAVVGSQTVQVFEARTGKPLSPALPVGSAQTLSPDGTRLSIAGADEIIRLFDARSGALLGRVGTGIPGRPRALVFTPDSQHLFVGTKTGAVHEVQVPSGEDLARFQESGDSIAVMAVDRSGRWLAVADDQNNVRIWDTRTRARVGPVMSGGVEGGAILALRFSRDGTKLALGTENLQVRLLDVQTGQQIGPDLRTMQAAEALAFTPDDEELRVITRDLAPQTFLLSVKRLRPIAATLMGRNATWSEWERYFAPEPYRRTFAEFGVHDSYLQEARRRTLDGRAEDALMMFRHAAILQPDLLLDAKKAVEQLQLVAQGEDRARAGDTAGAAADFSRAQALGWQPPRDIRRYANELAAQALTAEGVRHSEMNEVDQATRLFEKALLAIDGHPSRSQDYDGRIQRELVAAGASEYAAKLALNTLVRSASQLAELGRVDDAAEKLREAGRYEPTYAVDPVGRAKDAAVAALTKRGGESIARDDLDRARDLYRRAHEIDPSFDADLEFRRVLAGVKRGLVEGQAQWGKLELALKLIDDAQSLDPKPPEEVSRAKATAAAIAHKAKGDKLADEGQVEAAIAEYQAGLAQNPSLKLDPIKEPTRRRISAVRAQASTLLSDGDRTGALNSLKSLLKLDPGLSLDHELIVLTSPSSSARDDLRAYLGKDLEKAFVLTPLGSWQWAAKYDTSKEAVDAAMEGARNRYGGEEALVYMKGNTVVAPNKELSILCEMLRSSSQ